MIITIDEGFDKIFMIYFVFFRNIKNIKKYNKKYQGIVKGVREIKIRHYVFWFLFRPKKYRIFNDWVSKGTTYYFAYRKAKNNVPHFDKQIDKDRWIRKQKLKRILTN